MKLGDRIYVLDLTDAFFNWPIPDEDSNLLGIFDEHALRFGRYEFAPFGLKPSPGINEGGPEASPQVVRHFPGRLG